MMKTKLILFMALLPSFAFASVTISGTALNNSPGINTGETYVWLVDLDGSAFSTGSLASLDNGLTITSSATYSGFSVVGSGTVDDLFGNPFVGSGLSIDLTGGIDAGDSFGLLVFDNSSTAAIPSDTYNIFTDATWVLPSEGSTSTYGGALATIGSGGSVAGAGSVTAVPEPSAYAMLSGLLALSWVMVRRRA
jgi:hypothetical protein